MNEQQLEILTLHIPLQIILLPLLFACYVFIAPVGALILELNFLLLFGALMWFWRTKR